MTDAKEISKYKLHFVGVQEARAVIAQSVYRLTGFMDWIFFFFIWTMRL
jgi:cobalamin-dependent methionine synthase I